MKVKFALVWALAGPLAACGGGEASAPQTSEGAASAPSAAAEDPDPRHCGQSVAIYGSGDDPAVIQAQLHIPTSLWTPRTWSGVYVIYEAPPASMTGEQYRADLRMVGDMVVRPDDPEFARAAEDMSSQTGAPVVDRGMIVAALDDRLPVCYVWP